MINLRCSGVFFLLLAASAGALADSQGLYLAAGLE